MKQKMTAEEIQQLLDAAEKERQTHSSIVEDISQLKLDSVKGAIVPLPNLPEKRQMEIIERGKEKEIITLLEAYSRLTADDERNLCDKAQLFIYKSNDKGMEEAKKFMLEKNRLCLAVEKAMIDDRKMLRLSMFDEEFENQPPKKTSFSAEAECYLIEKTFNDCHVADFMSEESVAYFRTYTQQNKLSDSAQRLMVSKFLNVKTGRDSVIDGLRSLVHFYINVHRFLYPSAQEVLVKSNDHDTIMHYINYGYAKDGRVFASKEAFEALKKRADREEINAYVARYVAME